MFNYRKTDVVFILSIVQQSKEGVCAQEEQSQAMFSHCRHNVMSCLTSIQEKGWLKYDFSVNELCDIGEVIVVSLLANGFFFFNTLYMHSTFSKSVLAVLYFLFFSFFFKLLFCFQRRRKNTIRSMRYEKNSRLSICINTSHWTISASTSWKDLGAAKICDEFYTSDA